MSSITEHGISYIGKYDIAKIRKLLEWDRIYFWLIAGNTIHKFEKNWENDQGEGELVGGHHYDLPYIPENEIWISNITRDVGSTILYQYIERLLMKEEKFSKEEAKSVASKIVLMQKVVKSK